MAAGAGGMFASREGENLQQLREEKFIVAAAATAKVQKKAICPPAE